jgi:hypothetical protein
VSPGDWDYDISSESLGKMGWIVVDIGSQASFFLGFSGNIVCLNRREES